MKVYAFGEETAPVILLLPGTCCHWKGNFGHVIPLLSDEYRVLCVSYDGFDETERTEFPTMLEETAKIEDLHQGKLRRTHPRSLRLLARRLVCWASGRKGNIRMDYGILGSSDSGPVLEIRGKIADESSAVADVPDAARRQVQVAASAKARGKADAADG